MEKKSIEEAFSKPYSKFSQDHKPSYQPAAGFQLYPLSDMETALSRHFAKVPIKHMWGRPQYQYQNRPSKNSLSEALPSGSDSWALSGFYAKEGRLILQFLPTNNEQLFATARRCEEVVRNIYEVDEESSYDAEADYLASIYRLFAIEIAVTGAYNLQFDFGEDKCVLVQSRSTHFQMTEIETGVLVKAYAYQTAAKTATVTNYA